MTLLSHCAMQTQQYAKALARRLRGGEFLAFFGELGAGKTCFISALAKELGCVDLAFSPTFAIVNYYRGPIPMCHFDMYRMDEESLEECGFYEYLDSGAVIACEWCENIPFAVPQNAIRITMEKGAGENERIINIEGADL